MAATYQSSMRMLEPIEGGYCKGGMDCGSTASGETYRGIDRGQWPQWKGWQIIDAYKKKYGLPKWGTLIKNPVLDEAVVAFYSANFWNPLGFPNLNNQLLAALQYAFCVQRMYDAVGVFNQVAVKLGATVTSKTKITPQAAAAVERNIVMGYSMLRNAIIAYYQGRYAAATAKKYIDNRVNIFPAMLNPDGSGIMPVNPNSTTGGTTITASGTDPLQALGLFFTMAKLFM